MYLFMLCVGSLLNSVLSELIVVILSVEEYSVEDSECLQNVLQFLSSASVDLFRPSSSCLPSADSSSPEVTVQEVCPEWLRLRELSILVGAGLQEVDDRWSDGKGPTALYFSGEDVARLVAATFEKTTRRDALIGKLRRHHNTHNCHV